MYLVSVVFTILGSLIIKHSFKRGKSKHLAFDEFLLGVLHLVFAVLHPWFFFQYNNASELFLVNNLFLSATIIILLSLIAREFIRVKWHPSLKDSRSLLNFQREFLAAHSVSNEFKRRVTHLIPVLVIIPILLICQWLQLGDAWCTGLIVTIGSCFLFFFSLGDLVRVNHIELLPDWARGLFVSGLNKREVVNNTFTTTSSLVLGVAPWLLSSLFVFTLVTLVASVADAVAALTGFAFGKRHFPRGSVKTVAGYVGGVITAFLMVGAATLLFPGSEFLLTALTVSFAFFIIDLLNLPIDDNKLNPLMIGCTLLLIRSLL